MFPVLPAQQHAALFQMFQCAALKMLDRPDGGAAARVIITDLAKLNSFTAVIPVKYVKL